MLKYSKGILNYASILRELPIEKPLQEATVASTPRPIPIRCEQPLLQRVPSIPKQVRCEAMHSHMWIKKGASLCLLVQNRPPQHAGVMSTTGHANNNIKKSLVPIHNCLHLHAVATGLEIEVIFWPHIRLSDMDVSPIDCPRHNRESAKFLKISHDILKAATSWELYLLPEVDIHSLDNVTEGTQ